MPVFKIWSRDRTDKKSCAASSLEELKLKGTCRSLRMVEECNATVNSKCVIVDTTGIWGAPIKKKPFEEILYFSNGATNLSQTLTLYTTYHANFVETTVVGQQI